MEELQNKWKKLAKVKKITNADSKVIIDDVILHGETIEELLKFFRCVLTVLQQHRATVKLKKCKFLTRREEFVGRDILPRKGMRRKSPNIMRSKHWENPTLIMT